jgi:hypothetical protein
MTTQENSTLRSVTAWLFWLGGGLLVLTGIAFQATAIYEKIVQPTDMHLPGLLTAAMVYYAIPLATILLASAGLMRIGAVIVRRRKSAENIS